MGHSPEELQRAIQTHKPYIYDLEKLIQKMKFGQIEVVLRFHDGFVSDVVLVSKERYKYATPDRNAIPMPTDWQPKRVDDVPPLKEETVDPVRTTTYHSDTQPS